VDDPIIKDEGLSFDQIMTIFVLQYCSGKYLYIDTNTGIISVRRNNRTFRNTEFVIYYYGTTSIMNVLIFNGVFYFDIDPNSFPLTIRALIKEKTLFGIELQNTLTPELMNILLETTEFEEIVVSSVNGEGTYNPNMLQQVVHLLELRKLRVLREEPSYPGSITTNNTF